MSKPLAILIGNRLATPDGKLVKVGSRNWQSWLENPDNKSFRYGDEQGYTARKEMTARYWQCQYWYGYRKVGGKLHKRYIGKSEELTPEKLAEIDLALNTSPPPRKVKDETKLPTFLGNLSDGNQIELLNTEIRELQEKLGNLAAENQQFKAQLQELEEARAQTSTQVVPVTIEPLPQLPEAAELLNQLKARRKKSTATLADVEAILELLPSPKIAKLTSTAK